jgi:hypothetical protein
MLRAADGVAFSAVIIAQGNHTQTRTMAAPIPAMMPIFAPVERVSLACHCAIQRPRRFQQTVEHL